MSDPHDPPPITPLRQEVVDQLIQLVESETDNPHTGSDLLAYAFAQYVQKHFERPGPQGMTGHTRVTLPNKSISLAQPNPFFEMVVYLTPAR